MTSPASKTPRTDEVYILGLLNRIADLEFKLTTLRGEFSALQKVAAINREVHRGLHEENERLREELGRAKEKFPRISVTDAEKALQAGVDWEKCPVGTFSVVLGILHAYAVPPTDWQQRVEQAEAELERYKSAEMPDASDFDNAVRAADLRSARKILERLIAHCAKLKVEGEQAKQDVNVLNNLLRAAGWGQGEIDSAAETVYQLEKDLEKTRARLVEAEKGRNILKTVSSEWETTRNENEVTCHSRMVGGVLCRWWGEDVPPGVAAIDASREQGK